MARVIAVTNQKGGVGKTTTAVNLSACLAVQGKKVLLLDTDPQGNATSGIGLEKRELKFCIYDALINEMPLQRIIRKSQIEGLDVVPATIQLAGAEIELVSTISREVRLRSVLEEVREAYDYIIIDCPPSLGLLTLNALSAADTVLVPIQCEYYALEGLGQLTNTINLVKKHLNSKLVLEGVLLTMYDSRTNLSAQVAEEVRKHFGSKVFKAVIPRNVRLSEAPSYGQPIITYDERSKGAETYRELAKEVIANEQEKAG
ncbi:MAG: AAA family ATPase [Bacillota bacterium]|jgi:chromosome partitioning protein|nr:AAA family ATPase [Bacillota bacterium]HHU30058.1 ParA family protein [Bacillota bacterium]